MKDLFEMGCDSIKWEGMYDDDDIDDDGADLKDFIVDDDEFWVREEGNIIRTYPCIMTLPYLFIWSLTQYAIYHTLLLLKFILYKRCV